MIGFLEISPMLSSDAPSIMISSNCSYSDFIISSSAVEASFEFSYESVSDDKFSLSSMTEFGARIACMRLTLPYLFGPFDSTTLSWFSNPLLSLSSMESLFKLLASKLTATSSSGDAAAFCEGPAPRIPGGVASLCPSTL